jgi:putative flippase GtrA
VNLSAYNKKTIGFYKSEVKTWGSEAIKFSLIGVLNTILDIGLYFLLSRYIEFLVPHPLIAKVISYSAGILNSYYWNRRWTFKSQVRPLRSLISYFLLNLMALMLNTLVMFIGLNILGWRDLFAILLATTFSFGWSFIFSKLIVFKKPN